MFVCQISEQNLPDILLIPDHFTVNLIYTARATLPSVIDYMKDVNRNKFDMYSFIS